MDGFRKTLFPRPPTPENPCPQVGVEAGAEAGAKAGAYLPSSSADMPWILHALSRGRPRATPLRGCLGRENGVRCCGEPRATSRHPLPLQHTEETPRHPSCPACTHGHQGRPTKAHAPVLLLGSLHGDPLLRDAACNRGLIAKLHRANALDPPRVPPAAILGGRALAAV